ncbi:MAG: hypothetical protein C0602_00100 [Denitrovibrio sp.]|nr:MAG: hypothetical protein C0602_00100 [Denitrovibrio sp.]
MSGLQSAVENMEREIDSMLNANSKKDSSLNDDQDAGESQGEGNGAELKAADAGVEVEKDSVKKEDDTIPGQNNEDDPDEDTWKHKYNVLQGKYEAEVPRLSAELKTLKRQFNELHSVNQELTAKLEAKPEIELNPEEYGEYGDEMKKLAQYTVDQAKTIAALNAKLENTSRQVSQSSEATKQQNTTYMLSQLKAVVPDWETINDSQEFKSWLAEVNPYTRAQRQVSINAAVDEYDHEALILIFKDYMKEKGLSDEKANQEADSRRKNLEKQIQPKKRPGDAPTTEKIFTTSEIDKFYTESAQGKYTDEEFEKLNAEINKAVTDGRIRKG